VENILKRVGTVHQNLGEVDKLMKKVKNWDIPDPASLHDHYGSHFNLVCMVEKSNNRKLNKN
jgi:hypothetical protein